MMIKRLSTFFTIITLALVSSIAYAQSGPEMLSWTVDSGGGDMTGGSYLLRGTIGQPDAGVMTGGNYTLIGGFWNLLLAQPVLPGAFNKDLPLDEAIDQPLDLTLSWGSSLLATSYSYCLDTDADATCDSGWEDAGTALSAPVGGLVRKTTYTWQVRASNGAGNTEANGGIWWQFTTIPLAPGNFGKTNPDDGATRQSINLTFTWEAAEDATSYEVCVDESDNGICNGSWQDAGSETEFEASGLAQNKIYFWQVRAQNAAGETMANAGDWFSFDTNTPAPREFGKAAPADGSAHQALTPALSWESARYALDYAWCLDETDDNECDNAWQTTGGLTSVIAGPLISGRDYYWQVAAVNDSGTIEADEGDWWTFRSEEPIAEPFGKVSPEYRELDVSLSPTLDWNGAAGADSYDYCIDTNNNKKCDTAWVSTGTLTSADLSGLKGIKTYWWQVRAVNDYGDTYADGDEWWRFKTTAGVGMYDDASDGWRYSKFFAKIAQAGAYEDTLHVAHAAGEWAEFGIEGSSFTLTYVVFHGGGQLEVWVDGALATTLDQYVDDAALMQTWTSADLGFGAHSVRLVDAAGRVNIDAITVNP